jgi:NAD(P)-dependent dehydrogenase (short-subunit alcohol dehydrogenase family)
MEETLAGTTVVVTGGSTGIGAECARQVLVAGGRVVICARGAARLESTRESLVRVARSPVDVTALPADVTVEADLERVLDAATTAGGRLGLVHAAATLAAIGPVVEVDPAAWLETVRIDLFGAFLAARAACRRMIARGEGGSIVLFSGGGGTSAFPNFTAYGCSKAGVVRLAETLAQEVAPYGIRVNSVAPGFVATTIHEATLQAGEAAGAAYLERTRRELSEGGVSPEVGARAVVFLLSDRSAAITGRLLAAPHDNWREWPAHRAELDGSDLFTLRRIVPRDRGMTWQ